MTFEAIVVLAAIAFFIFLYSKQKSTPPQEKVTGFTLRPTRLQDFVGQPEAKKVITVMTRSGRLSDHLLLVGPAGTGKTTLANIAAGNAKLHTAIGGQIRSPKDAEQAILLGSDMLFMDEVHAASRKALEILYTALEDGVLHCQDGKVINLRPNWKFIAGTTDSGKLPAPFRDRFGHTIYLSYYSQINIRKILRRSAKLLGLQLSPSQIRDIARRARGTPRVANALLRRVKDFSNGGTIQSLTEVWEALAIDTEGLTSIDRQVLEILKNANKPVGLEQLAKRVGVDTSTISNSVEPYLLRCGLIDIKSGGRELC